MGKISISMPDELEDKLRKRSMEKFGMKKGCLSKAVEESVKAWLKEK